MFIHPINNVQICIENISCTCTEEKAPVEWPVSDGFLCKSKSAFPGARIDKKVEEKTGFNQADTSFKASLQPLLIQNYFLKMRTMP